MAAPERDALGRRSIRDPARGGALLLAAGHRRSGPSSACHQADAASGPRWTAAPSASSRVASGGGSGETWERPPIAGTTAVTASPSQSSACSSSGTANAAGGDAARSRSASASAATSSRVRSFQPTLANATTRPSGRRYLHDGLPVRPGCAHPHREVGARKLERPGEVVRQDEVGQIGVADARRHRDRRPPADQPLSHAGPQSAVAAAAAARRARAGAPLENCVTAAAPAPGARGRRQDLRAVASTGGRRSARSPASPAGIGPIAARTRSSSAARPRVQASALLTATPYRVAPPRCSQQG